MAAPAARQQRQHEAIRVRRETHELLKELAAREHQSMTQLVARLAVEERRRVTLQECNEAFARLKADPKRWPTYQAETAVLDGTIGDGLADDEGVEWDESLADAASW